MELYTKVSYDNSRHLAMQYSTSFGLSSRFFAKSIRPHIYAIYGLVRIADEVVDTYKQPDAAKILDDLEQEVYYALESGYSTNPVVHAFAQTANRYDIDQSLIKPFFNSMRMDLRPVKYSEKDYKTYIHGSAEVVGLMCLKVFTSGNHKSYQRLEAGAKALGSAYQKVNFLRDMAADYKDLGRIYFPGLKFEDFDEDAKQAIIRDIRQDFQTALPVIRQLPASSRKATLLSYVYYSELLNKLGSTPASTLKADRVRLTSAQKLYLMTRTLLSERRVS